MEVKTFSILLPVIKSLGASGIFSKGTKKAFMAKETDTKIEPVNIQSLKSPTGKQHNKDVNKEEDTHVHDPRWKNVRWIDHRKDANIKHL